MSEENEVNEGGNGGPEEEVPKYKMEASPTGKVDQVMWWAFRGKTRKELEKPPYNYRPGTIRVGFGRLAELEGSWVETQEKQEDEVVEKTGKQLATTQQKGMQIFAKGSPPEAIIEAISIPLVDGQGVGFEKGMKFGMSTLVLAVRVMQELASVAQGQVKPLIDLTRTVREGEAAAFKGGADEAAYKAAAAIQQTFGPMVANIEAASKTSGPDPMKSMMVRTMEPLLKNVMSKMIPGMQDQPPEGWSRRSE